MSAIEKSLVKMSNLEITIENIDNLMEVEPIGVDSVQLTLRIQLLSGKMIFIIIRNSPIPFKNFYSHITERVKMNFYKNLSR